MDINGIKGKIEEMLKEAKEIANKPFKDSIYQFKDIKVYTLEKVLDLFDKYEEKLL